MTDTEKIYQLLTDSKNPVWWLIPNNAYCLELAKYLANAGMAVQRWIPVTERLPESGERVIVCRGDKVEQGVFLGVNGWWKVYGTNTKKVTHWMPLPEPPREEWR